jgi:hypothetical protein
VHLHTSITASSLTILTVSRCTSTTYHRISAARVVCAPSITHCPHIVVATPGRLNSLTYYSHHCPASSPTTLTVSRHTNAAYHRISAAQVVCAPSITRRPHIVVVATPGQLNSITHYSHHCPASSPAILSVPRYTNATHHQVSATAIPTDRPSLSYHPHCLTLYVRCISSNFSHYHPN